ncbi:unnamed protein product [Phytomonas sp. EM1]|nr:unnamed protein product [Phytomonas sp. EM1]|eukprot:CCW65025.1 unnamed protein product [Phytomonas sp. isolate EM1]
MLGCRYRLRPVQAVWRGGGALLEAARASSSSSSSFSSSSSPSSWSRSIVEGASTEKPPPGVSRVRDPPRHLAQYGQHGYDFLTHLQSHRGGFTEGFMRLRVGVYVVGAVVVGVYALVWGTSSSFHLTTDPAPYQNSIFDGFPSDYVIIENRWTGRRRVVTIDPEEERKENGVEKEEGEGKHAETTPRRIRARTITLHRLWERLHVYQQKARAVVVVDAAAELSADRFVRTPTGVCCGDQLFPDPIPVISRETSTSSSSSSSAGERIYVEAWIRPREGANRMQRGALPAFEAAMRRVLREQLCARYHDHLLATTKATTRVYAEELLRGGVVRGGGVGLAAVVPDRADFAAEVLAEVRRRLGDDVIVCDYAMRFF